MPRTSDVGGQIARLRQEEDGGNMRISAPEATDTRPGVKRQSKAAVGKAYAVHGGIEKGPPKVGEPLPQLILTV